MFPTETVYTHYIYIYIYRALFWGFPIRGPRGDRGYIPAYSLRCFFGLVGSTFPGLLACDGLGVSPGVGATSTRSCDLKPKHSRCGNEYFSWNQLCPKDSDMS